MFSRVISVLMITGLSLAIASETRATESRRSMQLSDDLTAPWLLQISPKKKLKIAPSLRRGKLRGTTRVSLAVPPKVRSSDTRSKYLPQVVDYKTSQPAGTIVIDTNQRFLFLVMKNGKARRYGVGVGRPGFEWAGTHRITRKSHWPDWRPPSEMIAREKARGRVLPAFVPGGPSNPLGARALYLGSTLYRIHGSNEPWSIGQAVSSGCIRMRNEDVMDLYDRVGVGTKVIVS